MSWRCLQTEPIDIDSGIAPARARAVAHALTRRAVPIVVRRAGRIEPLASGALYRRSGLQLRLVLVTCKHVFDEGTALGDLALPLGDTGKLLALSVAGARAIEHPSRDLAAIELNDTRACNVLLQHWAALPVLAATSVAPQAQTYVVAGYPYAQMRRVDAVLYCRPVVVFARGLPQQLHCLSYARHAQRADGTTIHAPELDGVSGATVWAVMPPHDAESDCVLEPSSVQVAFKHSTHVRAEPLHALLPYLVSR